LKPFVTDTLGIEEGSGAYKVIRYMGLKAESLCIYGINMLKGTVQFGNTIGETIGNAALYNIYDDIDYKLNI
jgi:hypothetical protein